MTFNKCSIAGKSYGDVIDKVTGEVLEVTEVSIWFGNSSFRHSKIIWSCNFSNGLILYLFCK